MTATTKRDHCRNESVNEIRTPASVGSGTSTTRRNSKDQGWRKIGRTYRRKLVRKDQTHADNAFSLDSGTDITLYFDVADKVLGQFLNQGIETEADIEKAYLIGTRLCHYLSKVLPTHASYFCNMPETYQAGRLRSQSQLVEVLQYTEQLSICIDRAQHLKHIGAVLGDFSSTTSTLPCSNESEEWPLKPSQSTAHVTQPVGTSSSPSRQYRQQSHQQSCSKLNIISSHAHKIDLPKHWRLTETLCHRRADSMSSSTINGDSDAEFVEDAWKAPQLGTTNATKLRSPNGLNPDNDSWSLTNSTIKSEDFSSSNRVEDGKNTCSHSPEENSAYCHALKSHSKLGSRNNDNVQTERVDSIENGRRPSDHYFEHSPSIIPLLEESEDTNCIDDLEASDSSSKVDVFEDCKDDGIAARSSLKDQDNKCGSNENKTRKQIVQVQKEQQMAQEKQINQKKPTDEWNATEVALSGVYPLDTSGLPNGDSDLNEWNWTRPAFPQEQPSLVSLLPRKTPPSPAATFRGYRCGNAWKDTSQKRKSRALISATTLNRFTCDLDYSDVATVGSAEEFYNIATENDTLRPMGHKFRSCFRSLLE